MRSVQRLVTKRPRRSKDKVEIIPPAVIIFGGRGPREPWPHYKEDEDDA